MLCCIACSLQGMGDASLCLVQLYAMFVYLLLKGLRNSRTNFLPHSSLPFDTFTKKDNVFLPPPLKSVPKDLKRKPQSIKLIKLNPGKSTYYMHHRSCIFFKAFHWKYNINVLIFFPFILDSMCVKIWEPECGVTYCCYLVKPQSWNDK